MAISTSHPERRAHREDLVTDHAGTMRGVCNFLGVNYDASMLDPNASKHRIVNGNNMRFGEHAHQARHPLVLGTPGG